MRRKVIHQVVILKQLLDTWRVKIGQADLHHEGAFTIGKHALLDFRSSVLLETQIVQMLLDLARVIFRKVPLLLGCLRDDSQFATFDDTDPFLGRVVSAEG